MKDKFKNFWKDFSLGIKSYSKAFDILFTKNLAWFFLFPLVLNIVLFIIGTSSINLLIDYLEIQINNLIGLDTAVFWGSGVLRTVLSWTLYILFKLMYVIAFAYIGGKVVIIFMSPVFSVLSEKVDKVLTGNKYPFSAEQTMRDIIRGIIIASRNMLLELVAIIIIFALGLIPFIGWVISFIGTFVLFGVAAYFYGFSFMDYTSERKRLNISQSVKYINKNIGISIGVGSIFTLALIIPICGTLLASFVSIVAVTAATIAIHEKEIEETNKIKEIEGEEQKELNL